MVNRVETLDRTFAALADPTRRAIVDRLARGGGATVTELAEPFDMSLPAVLKHLGVLEDARLVRCEKVGRVRRCSLDARALGGAIDWIEERTRVWEGRLDRLERHLGKERQR